MRRKLLFAFTFALLCSVANACGNWLLITREPRELFTNGIQFFGGAIIGVLAGLFVARK